MKTTIRFDAPEQEWEQLKQTGSRGSAIRDGIHACTENPKQIAKVVETVIDEVGDAEPEEVKLKKTSIQVEVADVLMIDKLAKKLMTTRNNLLQLILKGVLAGVIR